MRLVILIIASVYMIENAFAAPKVRPFRLVCYYSSKAFTRPHAGRIYPEHIDPNVCTHGIYAFAALEDNKIVPRNPSLELDNKYETGMYRRFNTHFKKAFHVKTLISIGGWENEMLENNWKFSKMAKDPKTREIFVMSVIEFLKKHDFDGLDFAWSYPVFKGENLSIADAYNYAKMIRMLSNNLRSHGFVLSAAITVGKNTDWRGYIIKDIARDVDFINLLLFDFHGPWESFTGISSPIELRDDAEHREEEKRQTIDPVLDHWLAKGAAAHQINFGIPLYGRCYTLENKRNHDVGARSKDPGAPGPFTQLPGFMGLGEMCLLGYTSSKSFYRPYTDVTYGGDSNGKYFVKEDLWCNYEDQETVLTKMDYMVKKGVKSVTIWSYDLDNIPFDFCGAYPLTVEILKKLNSIHGL